MKPVDSGCRAPRTVTRISRCKARRTLWRVRFAVAMMLVGCAGNLPSATTSVSPTPTTGSSPSMFTTPSPSQPATQHPTATAGQPSQTLPESPTPTSGHCPNPDGGAANKCLGPLTAGPHTTSAFRPPLSYTVPDGWANYEDLPGQVLLLPPGATLGGVNPGTSDYIGVYRSVAAPRTDCSSLLDSSVSRTVAGYVSWLQANPALSVTKPATVSIGPLLGTTVDVSLSAGAENLCSDPVAGVDRFAEVMIGVPPSGFSASVTPSVSLRLGLFEVDRQLLAVLISETIPGGSDIDNWPNAAQGLAQTFRFQTAIVGTWHRTITCAEQTAAFAAAGLLESHTDWLGASCEGDKLPQEHAHFFTVDGDFGSRDAHGQQVDDGDYQISAEGPLNFPSHSKEFGYAPIEVTYVASADTLTFAVQMPPNCSTQCADAYAWATSAFGTGPWQAGDVP